MNRELMRVGQWVRSTGGKSMCSAGWANFGIAKFPLFAWDAEIPGGWHIPRCLLLGWANFGGAKFAIAMGAKILREMPYIFSCDFYSGRQNSSF